MTQDAPAIPEWATTALPSDLHDIPFLKDAQDIGTFKTRITAAAEHVGNSVRIPGPDAGQDDWSAFDAKLSAKIPTLVRADLDTPEGRASLMKRLGVPDAPTEYGAEGEGAWLADVAFKAGLTKSQFGDLIKGVGERNNVQAQTVTAAQQAEIDKLKTEWGFGYNKKMEHIAGLAKLTNAPEEFAKNISEGKVDANTLRWLDNLAGQFAETAKFSDDRNNPSSLTPIEAAAQIQELINNPDYWEETAIGTMLRKKMLDLQRAAHP